MADAFSWMPEAGNTILRRLREAWIDWKHTRDIFVTHKHIDHILGIVWMMRIFCQNMKRGSCNGEARIYAHRKSWRFCRTLQ